MGVSPGECIKEQSLPGSYHQCQLNSDGEQFWHLVKCTGYFYALNEKNLEILRDKKRNSKMGRNALCVMSLLGYFSVAMAGTYHPDFSFLASESNNYSPLQSYYVAQPQQETAPKSSQQPVVRKNRGIAHTHTYTYASPIYVSKAPLYYPESAVFSDPLPIVPLPQLPSEFLTLKTATLSNTGDYAGSENEVPKKSSRSKKGRRTKTTTPAPVEEEIEEEDDTQETEADEGQGGYESPRPRSRQREEASGGYPSSVDERPRNRQREEGSTSRQRSESSGGYPSNLDANAERPRSRQREEGVTSRQRSESSGGYPSNFDANAERSRQLEEGAQAGQQDAASGGYPSNFDANANDENQKASSGSRSRSRSRSRSNRNRGNSQEEEDELPTTGEIEGDQEEDEIMMTGEDAELDDENNSADAELDEEEQAEEEPKKPARGRSRGSGRGQSGKKSGKGKGRSRGNSAEDEEALNSALSDGPKIDSIFVPTFGNNVLNTVYPAYTANALLKSLESQVGIVDQGYPESGQDVSAISIAADDNKKRSRKSKKRTSARKNRPASRGRSSSRRSKNRPSSNIRAQEPNDQTQGGYPNSPAQSQGSQGQSPQYGPPQFTPGNPTSQYGAPSSQQSQGGINPPPQSGSEGGYRTIGNELRGRSSQPQQEYGAPSSGNELRGRTGQLQQEYGAPASGGSRASFIEPRQVSQSTVVATGNNDQLSSVADSNNPVTAELIRTVQAILQRYPN